MWKVDRPCLIFFDFYVPALKPGRPNINNLYWYSDNLLTFSYWKKKSWEHDWSQIPGIVRVSSTFIGTGCNIHDNFIASYMYGSARQASTASRHYATHGHIFVRSKACSVLKWGLLFHDRRGVTTAGPFRPRPPECGTGVILPGFYSLTAHFLHTHTHTHSLSLSLSYTCICYHGNVKRG
jgi:hypothetical protein